MKKKIIVALVALAIMAATGIFVYGRANRKPTDRIVISGNIELTEIDVAFKYSGKLIQRTATEGDEVQKGAVLARLDQEQLVHQREREQAALKLAQAQLAQAQTALQWQQQITEADVDQRRAELNSSRARLQELQNGARPQEVQEAVALVKTAEAEFERADSDWKRAQILFNDDDISRSQYDQFRMRFETSRSALNQARQRLSLVQAGPRAEVIEAAGAQVARAAAGLKAGQANELETHRRRLEISARLAEIARAHAQIAMIDSQLADGVVVAPASGIVLTKAAEVGEVLAPGTTVLTIGDLQHPWLRGYINERDLGRVKVGSKAKVTTDSYPGKEYWGRVSFVASEAEFTPKQIQTAEERVKLVYRVKIELDNPNQELKLNMPADAEIVLEP
jgi:HlyD family secretion protein